MSHRHRVVIIGAGFGGLRVARGLRSAPVDVVIIDRNNFHTFQPLLYQVATAGLDGDDICYAVRGTLRGQRNVDFLMGEVTGVDLTEHEVLLANGHRVGYDHLVVAAGAVTADYGVPGVAEHAFGLKSLDDAMAIRNHVLRLFEDATHDPTAIERGQLTVVIAGGGPTGVEIAGGMRELFDRVLAHDYPNLAVHRARVVLVEAADRLLATFAPSLGRTALTTLSSRGVEVLLGTGVQKVEATAVHLSDGRIIEFGTMVWAAGVKASPLAAALGVPLTSGGRIVVAEDLSIPDHPEVFAIGDIAASPQLGGGFVPQVAPGAMQGAVHVAEQIMRRLRNEPTVPFRYKDKGSMATIGRNHAVAQLPGGIKLSGFVGWVAWLGLHLLYLVGFRNRANVLVNWAWNYVTYDRGSRLITRQG